MRAHMHLPQRRRGSSSSTEQRRGSWLWPRALLQLLSFLLCKSGAVVAVVVVVSKRADIKCIRQLCHDDNVFADPSSAKVKFAHGALTIHYTFLCRVYLIYIYIGIFASSRGYITGSESLLGVRVYIVVIGLGPVAKEYCAEYTLLAASLVVYIYCIRVTGI